MTFLSLLISHNGLTFKLFCRRHAQLRIFAATMLLFAATDDKETCNYLLHYCSNLFFFFPSCGNVVFMIYPVLFGIPNAHELGALSASPDGLSGLRPTFYLNVPMGFN